MACFQKVCVMDAYIPPFADVAAFVQPQEIARKKRRDGRNAAIVIGTILILSDGSECVVAAFDSEGNPLCAPADQ